MRDYNELDLRRVDFIKCMRSAGLPIEVLIEYVALVQKGDKTIDTRNAEVSAQHLELIWDANPDIPIILFWDRAPRHRVKPIDNVLEAHPRLEIIFFPTACPDLNPQEQVWKAVRHEVSHNHIEVKLPELADRFLNKLNSTTFTSSFLEKYGYSAICSMFI